MKQFKKVLSVLLVSLLVFSTALVAFADTTESEDNSTAATATAFTSAVTGSLASIDDVDYFKTTVTTAGTAKLTFVSTSTSGAYKVEILDSSEKSVTSFDVAAGAGTTTSSEFSVSNADYYVKVSAGSVSGTETYSISITVTAATTYTEVEPNNTAGTATEVASAAVTSVLDNSIAYSGAISAGDVDYYKVVISNPEGFFRIKFYNTESSAFKVTVIQNSTGKNVAEMDITETDENVTCADIGVANGTYYVKVEGADAAKTGGYSFKVVSKLDAECEAEYNGDASNATVLVQGTKKYASISLASDLDYYKVTSNQDTKITVSAVNDSRNDSSVTWTAKLYVSTDLNTPKATVTVSKAQSAVFDLRDYDSAIYYIVVSKGDNYSTGNYVISSEAVTKETTTSTSLIDRIKALDWSGFWTNNFKDLLGNIDIWSTLAALLKLSIGTISKYIAAIG